MGNISIPDELREQATARATEGGFANVNDLVAALVRAEAAGAPDGLRVESDDALRAVVESRADGPWVDVDAADFARIRPRFQEHLDRNTDPRS